MDLHRTSILNQMDYSRESKEGKQGAQPTEERLDSGLDSLKEEEYQAVAAEIRQLQLKSDPSPPQQQQLPAAESQEQTEWRAQITEDGDT